ncbi:MAG TPA: hypothetical protein VLC52_14795 [Anaerolineae bacterium]|nr:hypothetical protein [Anaerolineae bacterium]
MISPEFGLDISLMAYRVEEARHRPEVDSLCRDLRVARPRRLSRQGGRLLARLGQSLVALGQRLERRSLPQPSIAAYHSVYKEVTNYVPSRR